MLSRSCIDIDAMGHNEVVDRDFIITVIIVEDGNCGTICRLIVIQSTEFTLMLVERIA